MGLMNNLRMHLDVIDKQILDLLSERMTIIDEIANYKKSEGQPVEDGEREAAILNQARQGISHFVLKEAIQQIYSAIIDCSKTSQLLRQTMAFPFARVGIIGVGLIGGSIAKAIKAKDSNVRISTLSVDSPDLVKAQTFGVIDHVETEMADLCGNVDVIILAVPPGMVIEIAQKLVKATSVIQSRTLVICDVAGVKKQIVSAFERLQGVGIECIGTHPMAGTEKSGFDNSSPLLFANARWIVTPHAKNTAFVKDKIMEMIAFFGASGMMMDAEKHDQQAALVSHLPGVVSELLLKFAMKEDEKSVKISGSGFRSMTRLANDNPAMRRQILDINRSYFADYWQKWIVSLQRFGDDL